MSDKENIQDDWEKLQKEIEILENRIEDLRNLNTDDTDDAVLTKVLKVYNRILNEILEIASLKETCTAIVSISSHLKLLPASAEEATVITRYTENIRKILNSKMEQLGNMYSNEK